MLGFVILIVLVGRDYRQTVLLLLVILLMVVFVRCVSDRLLYIMNICQLIHGIVGSSAEWYGDSVIPALS